MAKQILIVDDEKALARALELKLIHEGFEVEIVFNGTDAIKTLKNKSFDLVLLDLVMPQEDGFAVLEKIEPKKKKMLVIVSSNLSQTEDIEKAKSLGATDYIVKSDTTLAKIVEKIEKYLDK